ncbi:MAG: amidase domain-containing protein [Cellulosilyticaceae bacterium]
MNICNYSGTFKKIVGQVKKGGFMSTYRSGWYTLLSQLTTKGNARKNFHQEKIMVKQLATEYLKARGGLVEKLSLKLELLDNFYANTAKAQQNLEVEKIILSTIIEHHCMQRVDLKAKYYNHKIKIKKINLGLTTCSMHIGIEEVKRYKHLNKDTVTVNNTHRLELVKENGVWKIEDHFYEDDFQSVLYAYQSKLQVDELNKAKDTYLSNVRNSIAHETLRKENAVQEENIKRMLEELYSRDDIKPYNRSEAIEYALEYALEPNPTWKDYEKFGGDCTNFTSQCLYIGGIPFNKQGHDINNQWYWYSDSYRTPSWTSSTFFLDYTLADREVGLVAHLGDKEDLRLGDMVQLGRIGKSTHSMIVTEFVYSKNEKDKVIDYLVCQHSDNAKNLPLSTKPLPRIYILIDGYKPK